MITLEKAKKAIEAAEKKAEELGVKVATAVVDDHGTLIALNKMDEALYISPRFASAKAFTSANLGTPTEGLAGYEVEGKPYFGLNTLFGGELTAIAGGVPVTMHGKVVGAIGVGGSMDVSQDAQCAQAAAEIFKE